MIRGTTPRQVFVFNEDNLDTLKNIEITYSQDDEVKVHKTKNNLMIDENIVYFRLSQEETLSLSNAPVEVQVRILTADNVAIASRIFKVPVLKILSESEIVEV